MVIKYCIMNYTKLIIIIIGTLLLTACIRYSKTENEADEDAAEMFDETDEVRIRTGDSIDYSNIVISIEDEIAVPLEFTAITAI